MMDSSAKRTLVILALVCTLPVVASYLTYYFWQPSDTVNYGELIPPTPLPQAVAQGFDEGSELDRDTLRGKWYMVYVGPGECDERCQSALYAMRQTWLAQGEELHRVGRLWLVTDGVEPDAGFVAEQRGIRVAQSTPAWLEKLPAHDNGEHFYLVDPIGNVMMRYPPDPDIRLVIKDLQRLLKYSGLG